MSVFKPYGAADLCKVLCLHNVSSGSLLFVETFCTLEYVEHSLYLLAVVLRCIKTSVGRASLVVEEMMFPDVTDAAAAAGAGLRARQFDFVRQLLAARVRLEVKRMVEQVLDLVVEELFGLFLPLDHPGLLGPLLTPASLVVVHLSQQVGATFHLLVPLSLFVVHVRLARGLHLIQQHLTVLLTIILAEHRLLGCQSQQTYIHQHMCNRTS